MGRDIGTNVYSNNFEPQVMGLLDARTRVDTKADLTKTDTWTSADGNTYVPVGIRVSVTDDSTSGNNGVYMLMSEDYAIASNWMKIGSGGSAEFVMVDLSSINAIPGTYSPDKYIHGEFAKIIDATANNLPFFVFTFDATAGLFATSCVTDGTEIMLTILYRDEIWLINFDGGNYTVAKADMGGSSVSSNVKVLTTANLIDSSRTSAVQISLADISTLRSATDKDVFVYNGVIGGMTTTIPMTITFTQPPATALQMVISYAFIDRTYYIAVSATDTTQKDVLYADAPREMANGSGGGSSTSNVKVLTTPDLLNASRTSSIQLSSSDVSIWKSLQLGKDLVIYSGSAGNITQYIPLSISRIASGNIESNVVSFMFSNSMYLINISTTNLTTYTASKPTKAEGSGGGDSSKLYTTTLNLGDISTRDNKAPSDAERVEVDNIISKVQEGYTILSVQNDVGVNDSNSRYSVVGVTLSEDRKEIWMQVVDQWNVLTISYNKKVLGAPFYCYYLQKKTEIVELPSDASANMPYENGDYNGSNQGFANKIREISINPTNNYVLKFSPNGYYTVINPYRASSYAGFYLSASEGETYHIYTSITTTDSSYTIQSEGSYELKQDQLVSGKNIKTINGQSLLGSGNIAISGSGGGSSEAAYLTTLDLWGTITSDPLSQDEYDEIINIFNKWKAGIPIVVSMRDYYNGILNISTNRGDITEKSTISFSITRDDKIEIWKVLMKVGSSWERVYKNLPTEISLYDIVAENATDLLTSNGEELYDSIMMLDSIVSSGTGEPIYANYFDSLGGYYPISIRDTFPSFVVNYSGREFQINYQINGNNTITYSVTDVTKYDLSLDVRISNNKIQYRIHEVAPNGYICFYRKKRCRNSITNRPHVNKYTIPDFYFSSKIGTLGFPAIEKKYMIPASNAQLNTWTDFPMEVLKVFSTNSTTSVGFTGTVHATSCNKDTATNNWDKWVTVLNMGLAYNVVNPNFINGIKENNAYPTDIIQSGDMVKFKCRLMVPYELRYTMY